SVDVKLVAAHGEFVRRSDAVRDDGTPVVDAAISGRGDAVIDFEFEVGWGATFPDQEGVALYNRGGRDFAGDDAVFHAPIRRVAVPALEGFAVAHLLKAGLFAGKGLGPVALLRRVLSC